MAEQISEYQLFNGKVRNVDVNLGINQSPTVVTMTVVEDGIPLNISNRSLINIDIGSFNLRGIVQSWSKAKIDIAGTGVYKIRITDTKPVLDAVSVVLVSPFDVGGGGISLDYGDNVVGVVPKTNEQLKIGVQFDNIKENVEKATFKYGNNTYSVKFNFNLPSKGSTVAYSLKNRALSLSELISQIANDHGLNWYVTTSINNTININMFGRTNITDLTVNQLAAFHDGAIIRRHEGLENRDAIQKVVVIGGISSFLNRVPGDLWNQFWGLDSSSTIRSEPVYDRQAMKDIINNNIDAEKYTEDTVQSIMSYANEFWGRRFIALASPESTIDSNDESWVVPVSTAWNHLDSIPLDFDSDGFLKFQAEDGRWSTFVSLPLPGRKFPSKNLKLTFKWDDELYNNPNSHVDDFGTVAIKTSLEIVQINSAPYFLLTLGTPLRVLQTEHVIVTNSETGNDELLKTFSKVRAEFIETAFLALMDKRTTYGPWYNSVTSIGKTETIIDSSLTPWLFGYRGITNIEGIELMNRVALGRVKTIADTVMDTKTAELEVAGLPAINIGDQLQTTGTITSLQIVFGINGVKTTYKSLQYTNELSKNLRKQQDLLDKLRRQAAEFNNTAQPPHDNLIIDEAIKALKKELPEPSVSVSSEGQRDDQQVGLGRISLRTSLKEPRYNITPMAWISDALGKLTLVRDPKIFGEFLDIINMGEKQTSRGRLSVGTDVQVHQFSMTEGGIVSRYIDVSAPPPPNFTALTTSISNPNSPIYSVQPIFDSVQKLILLPSELTALATVPNIGEPANMNGFLPIGTEVSIGWNELSDGSFTPFMEQQLNMFKLPS